ncbi:unnamed protein product [Boreogadus saida]
MPTCDWWEKVLWSLAPANTELAAVSSYSPSESSAESALLNWCSPKGVDNKAGRLIFSETLRREPARSGWHGDQKGYVVGQEWKPFVPKSRESVVAHRQKLDWIFFGEKTRH